MLSSNSCFKSCKLTEVNFGNSKRLHTSIRSRRCESESFCADAVQSWVEEVAAYVKVLVHPALLKSHRPQKIALVVILSLHFCRKLSSRSFKQIDPKKGGILAPSCN
jgi:hypothetical protein